MKVLTMVFGLLTTVFSGYLEANTQYGLNCDSCWVMIAPTNFNPQIGRFPSQTSIREDIDTLFRYSFRGLGTYASDGTLYHIPRIAREQGFTGKIIMGIWDPTRDLEIANAISCSSYVNGYCVANEWLDTHPNDTTIIEQVIDSLKQITGKPVTTAEQIDDYLGGPYAQWLLNHGDWLFPIAHPYWAGITDPQDAVDWTVHKFSSLCSLTSKQVILKEVGLPSAGCSECSEENQAQYYHSLEQTNTVFFYFEAFDQPWKDWAPVEPYWGLFKNDRYPKKVVEEDTVGCDETKPQYDFSLDQNFPNPFYTITRIQYSVTNSYVTLRVYDLAGSLVKTLVDTKQVSGCYSANWDGKNNLGKKVPTGIYFYRLQVEDWVKTRKMILLK